MYPWAFLITAAVGLVAGLVAIVVGEALRRRGRWSASGLRWACFGTGSLGALMLVGGFMFPQMGGRTPPQDGVAFTPNPFTDPLVPSCGLGSLALVVGWYLAIRASRSWPARVGLGTGWSRGGSWSGPDPDVCAQGLLVCAGLSDAAFLHKRRMLPGFVPVSGVSFHAG